MDLGFSREWTGDNDMFTACGSTLYIAPEVLTSKATGRVYGRECDVCGGHDVHPALLPTALLGRHLDGCGAGYPQRRVHVGGTKDRRIVFTASTKEHASRCLAKVLAPSTVDDLFSVIVDKRTCKLDTKHSPASFAAAMDAAGVPPYVRASGPASCILIDDSVTNIKCAKQMRCTLFLFVPRWATRSGRGRIISSATCVIFSSATCGPPWNKKERGGREKRRINDALMS